MNLATAHRQGNTSLRDPRLLACHRIRVGLRAAPVRGGLASLSLLPAARDAVRSRLRSHPSVPQLEAAIRSKLVSDEAYNDIPGEDPQYC